MAVLDSIDTMIENAQVAGMWRRSIMLYPSTAATPATNTSGWINAHRVPQTIAAPGVGGSYDGMYLTYARLLPMTGGVSLAKASAVLAIEYTLGTLTLNGDSFADGVAMPSKLIDGATVQTCADMALLHVSTAGTATTPVITTTYTNERGTTSRTCALTLPTTPNISSAYLMNPHLQAGDSGIRDITGMSSSVTTGTMVLKATGLLILAMWLDSRGGNVNGSVGALESGLPPYKVESGEAMAMYTFGNTRACAKVLALAGIAAD